MWHWTVAAICFKGSFAFIHTFKANVLFGKGWGSARACIVVGYIIEGSWENP